MSYMLSMEIGISLPGEYGLRFLTVAKKYSSH